MPPTGWDEKSMQDILEAMGLTEHEFPQNWGHELRDVLSWVETPRHLGMRDDDTAIGAPLLTLDDLYHLARTDWLVKQDHAETIFEVDDNGLMSSCGYIPSGCQDDCFVGVIITKIEAL